jgi:hypothetical protein
VGLIKKLIIFGTKHFPLHPKFLVLAGRLSKHVRLTEAEGEVYVEVKEHWRKACEAVERVNEYVSLHGHHEKYLALGDTTDQKVNKGDPGLVIVKVLMASLKRCKDVPFPELTHGIIEVHETCSEILRTLFSTVKSNLKEYGDAYIMYGTPSLTRAMERLDPLKGGVAAGVLWKSGLEAKCNWKDLNNVANQTVDKLDPDRFLKLIVHLYTAPSV